MLDEVLAEIERLEGRPGVGPTGFTSSELEVRLGVCESRVRQLIRNWARDGLIEFAGKRETRNIAGGRAMIPVYRLVRSGGWNGCDQGTTGRTRPPR